jgi:hypothetical protein
MPWMPHSIFADGWVDHQLLFHTLMHPFTRVFDGVTAAKVSAAFFAAVAFDALRRLLRSMEIPWAGAVALIPAALSWQFLLRMEMPRTQSLSLALLLAGVGALVHRRPKLLFAWAFVYAWTYQVALLILPIAVLHALVFRRDTGVWKGPAAALGGLVAGFTLHPHFPRTWEFLHQHVVLKVLNRQELPVGSEWTTTGTAEEVFLVVLVAVGMHVVPSVRNPGAASRRARFFVGLAVGGLIGTLISVKFVEYGAPLAVLGAVAVARDEASRRSVSPALLWAVLAVGLSLSAWHVRSAVLETEPDPDRLAPAMTALDAHAAPGDVVYHFGWSDFPELVFHGPEYRFIVGLDPHFLALHDPALWELYAKIERGWGTNPSKPIRERFGASWAVLVLPHEGAEELLSKDSGLQELHRDEHAVVYAVAP